MTTAVVKIGGSLALYPNKLRLLCKKLSQIAKLHRILIVPGGGEFSDVVRTIDDRFSLSSNITHRMAILGMDQYGLMVSDLTPNSVVIRDLDEAKRWFDLGKVPILLPSKMMFEDSTLENSWDVTSDSISFFVAQKLQAKRAILVTDVDGIYDVDPKRDPKAKLLKKVLATELLESKKRTSVDLFLPSLLLQCPVDCFVVNGLFPERVVAVICGQKAVCTLIKC